MPPRSDLPARARALTATDLIGSVCDPGSFRSWDEALPGSSRSAAYAADLERAQERSGADEAVLTGEGLVGGRRVALIASEFGFLGGSIGVAAAERLVRAVERATAERLPLLAGPASGGTRMQEGTLAFLQMVKITAAIQAHKAQGLAYFVYLRNPTTGGVMASWASLGHVTVAEPAALLGFLGPRVYEAMYGEPFPEGVQRAENLLRHGLIDGILRPHELPEVVGRVLDLIQEPSRPVEPAPSLPTPSDKVIATSPWESIARSRRPERPGIRHLLHTSATDVLPLSGTGEGENEPGLLLALARIGGEACVIVGQDREAQRSRGPLGPGALRAARRGMRLARELDLPLVTIIDTPGAALSPAAEEGGLAGEIARSLADLIAHPTATVSVLLGEGTGGGALALFPADARIAAQHAWLSPLPPEGASVIVHGNTDHAAEMAVKQGVWALRLLADGIVDLVVEEHPDAADESEQFSRRMGDAIGSVLSELGRQDACTRIAARHDRYRLQGVTR